MSARPAIPLVSTSPEGPPDEPPIGEVTFDELRRILRNGSATVVNALSPEAYAASHIPGSINLPLAEIADRAGMMLPDRQAPIVVYCAADT